MTGNRDGDRYRNHTQLRDLDLSPLIALGCLDAPSQIWLWYYGSGGKWCSEPRSCCP